MTFRFSAEVIRFVRDGAKARDITNTDYVDVLLRDAMNFHGLPPDQQQRLEAERDALKYDPIEYSQYVLWMRALELRRKGPGFDLAQLDRSSLGVGGHVGKKGPRR